MFYDLLVPLVKYWSGFNVFRYITFRTAMAAVTAIVISFALGPWLIRRLRMLQDGEDTIREDTPERHRTKAGTPTMGGLLILAAILVSALLWSSLRNRYVWVLVLATTGLGLIGFLDDRKKLKTRKGLSARQKLGTQLLWVGALMAWLYFWPPDGFTTGLAIPFFKGWLLTLGWLWVPFSVLVIVGASNAVNLTDGLDGLAIVPVMIAAASFGMIAYLTGNAVFADYLQINYVAGTGELAVLCGAVLGAGLGFLWFNAPPASIFMGDTGSLALGGMLGSVAVATKHEIVLAVIGGLFVLEAVSVIVQVASFKLTGKRVFRMAPIHHHFEQKGWTEPQIVIRFWIISIVLALAGLSTLKLR